MTFAKWRAISVAGVWWSLTSIKDGSMCCDFEILEGGVFRKGAKGLQYIGDQGKIVQVDADIVWWWFLEDPTKESDGYSKIDSVHHLLPKRSLDKGLRRVYNGAEMLEMTKIANENRSIDLYADVPDFCWMGPLQKNTPAQKSSPPKQQTPPQKKIPTKEKTVNYTLEKEKGNQKLHELVVTIEPQPEDYYDWYGERPKSPIPYKELASDVEDSDEPRYSPEDEEDEDKKETEDELDENYVSELKVEEEEFRGDYDGLDDDEVFVDSTDDELVEARNKVKGINNKMFDLAQ
ncbi:hypothetical protein RDABS01_003687 [Bienertia sinuspersici]